MSVRRPRLALVLAVLAPLGVSCSSSTTDPSPAPALSASEAASIGSALNARTFDAVIAQAGPTLRGATGTVSVPCPEGGTVAVTYTVAGARDSTHAGVIAATTTLTPQHCAESTGSRTVTIDGDPSVRSTLTVTLPSGTTSGAVVAGHVIGAVKIDGASCALDYTVSSSISAGTTTVTGTVCGRSINVTR